MRGRVENVHIFCEYVVELYGDIYLWKPTRSDVEQLYVAHQAKHGLQECLVTLIVNFRSGQIIPMHDEANSREVIMTC